mgnify:CR=1 FL=1
MRTNPIFRREITLRSITRAARGLPVNKTPHGASQTPPLADRPSSSPSVAFAGLDGRQFTITKD